MSTPSQLDVEAVPAETPEDFLAQIAAPIANAGDIRFQRRLDTAEKHKTVQYTQVRGPVVVAASNTNPYVSGAKDFASTKDSFLALLANHCVPGDSPRRHLAVWAAGNGTFGILTSLGGRGAKTKSVRVWDVATALGPEWRVEKVVVADRDGLRAHAEQAIGGVVPPSHFGVITLLLASGLDGKAAEDLARSS